MSLYRIYIKASYLVESEVKFTQKTILKKLLTS